MKSLIFSTLMSLIVSISANADQNTAKCQFGCEAQAKCESLATNLSVKLFGTADQVTLQSVTTEPIQVETYVTEATQGKPGHIIFISYGFKDETNPTGACRVEMIDQQCLTCGQ